MGFPYHADDNQITVWVSGQMPQLARDKNDPLYQRVITMLNDPGTEADELLNVMKPIGAVTEALQGKVDVRVEGGQVFVNGELVVSALTQRLTDIMEHGLDLDPWVRFTQNIFANPFVEAREEFYTWMERAKMPITPDGCFLAFKVVRQDFMDRHTGTVSYKVGEVASMPRENCDNESRALCSKGLHFCSKDYLPQFGVNRGDHVLVVKINPADVVSIPENETAKGRAWRMEPVGEISPEQAGIKQWLPVDDSWDVDDEYDDVDDDETDLETMTDVPVKAVASKEVFITTKQFGQMTASDFKGQLARLGSFAEIARSMQVPAGTVSDWVRRFREAGAVI